ncbi:MAG TPA: hypothetical protein VKZ77_10945, partial [Bacillaceae bacterium]|nr:hypothetical protein [Bacillaceae bacterium]
VIANETEIKKYRRIKKPNYFKLMIVRFYSVLEALFSQDGTDGYPNLSVLAEEIHEDSYGKYGRALKKSS